MSTTRGAPRGRRKGQIIESAIQATHARAAEASAIAFPPELTVEEVAEYLRLKLPATYALVRAGYIAAYRLHDGPKAPIRIRREDFEAYLASRSAVAKTRDEG